MIEPQDFVQRWTYSPLVRLDERDVQPLNVSEETQRFLLEAGLPCEPIYRLNCDLLAQGLMRLSSVPGYDSVPDFTHYYILGRWETGGYLCYDETNGAVLSLKYENSMFMYSHLMNSSIPQFAECVL